MGFLASASATSTYFIDSNTPFSIAFWSNISSTSGSHLIIGKQNDFTGHTTPGWEVFFSSGRLYLQMNNGSSYQANELQLSTTSAVANGSMNYYIVTYDGSKSTSGVNFYVNHGAAQATTVNSNTLTGTISNNNNLSIGGASTSSVFTLATIDELMVYNGVLNSTQLSQLWNNGAGLQYGSGSFLWSKVWTYYKFDEQAGSTGIILDVAGGNNLRNHGSLSTIGKINYAYHYNGVNQYLTAPVSAETVVINYPINGSYLKTPSFTANSSVGGTISNVSFFINGNYSSTNISGHSGYYYFSINSLSQGKNNITVESCNIFKCINVTSIFYVDTQSPRVLISAPSSNINYLYQNKNLTLNFTASDNMALNKVWYTYNGSNHTVSGVTNGTLKTVYFNYQLTKDSITVWANDSAGNYNHTTLNWGYKVEQKSITYPSQAIIQTQGTYILNFSASMVSDVFLVFGGTSYQATFIYPGYYSAYKTITMPVVSVPTNESFYFNITFSDGSTVQTNTYHTNVIPFSIDTCGTNTYHLLYYQFKDEDTLLNLSSPNTFNMSTQLLFYSGNNLFYNYSTSTNKIDAVSFCSSKNLTQYGFTMNIANRYLGANRTTGYNLTEYYNVQAQSLTTTKIPLKINLYALSAKDKPTYFQITYNNQFFEPETGILLSLERFYPSLNGGTYITVQSPVTDSFGNTPAWFLTDSQQYKIVASQNGNILATYNNYFPQCQNPGINTCSLQLNAIGSVNNLPTFGTDLTYSTHYSNTTFTTDFSTTTGLQHNFTLIGYYSNGSRLCSSSIFTSSGSLTCTFSHSTNLISYLFYFYRDGQEVFFQQVNEGQTLGQSLGASAFVAAFLLVLLFGMMFITSPIMIIVGTLMGLIVASLFTLTGGGLLFGASSAFIFIALAGFIIMWRISRSPYGR